jgi:glycosyltransferase involved in cell wall biosynthesis
MKNKTRVCYVVCYKDPDYIRTITLTSALAKIDNIELKIIKNKKRGVLRYLEVPFKLFFARLSFKPDVFIVGFRAQEIFWAFYPSMAGKKIIFDEFINLHDWLIHEHHKLKEGSFTSRIIDSYMRWVLKRSDQVLEDTEAHAKLSQKIYKVPAEKLVAIPVGADETIFYPRPKTHKTGKFEVFFYGNMLPLHGLDVILESIKLIKEKSQFKNMHFTIIGGKGSPEMIQKVTNFIKNNSLSDFIEYKQWVNYKDLPDYIANADLCLGGPFGNTSQAKRVITGKTYQFLAMAKPTVIGENYELAGFVDKKNCLLVKQGSADDLSTSILWAVRNSERVDRIGRAGRRLYEEHFTMKPISQILERYIIDAI